jgi:integrase
MKRPNLIENHESGLLEGEQGKRFIRCDFNPNEPVLIDVTGQCWWAVYAGRRHELDWKASALPVAITRPLQQIFKERLTSRAPTYLCKLNAVLSSLGRIASRVDLNKGFSEVSASAWLKHWSTMPQDARSTFRGIYMELALRQMAGASFSIAKEMESWKARYDVLLLRHVLEWDAERGALSTAETKVALDALKPPEFRETDKDNAIRVYVRILFETLQRPIQVLSMKADALWVPAGSPSEYFLKIPNAKGQAAERPKLWSITEDLGKEIISFSTKPAIRMLQQRHDRLLVLPSKLLEWAKYGQVDSQTSHNALRDWAKNKDLQSPRTKGPLNLTALRIRHTGGTRMAIHGADRGAIQATLGHGSPESSQAYLDCIGADLIPVFERTDRGLGAVFSELSKAFFKGAIVDEVGRRPIYIPVVVEGETPAVVGCCGKQGPCKKHPLWACYNDCSNFLAWRQADHGKALVFATSEYERWSAAEGGKERSKLAREFGGTVAGITEVMNEIAATATQPD